MEIKNERVVNIIKSFKSFQDKEYLKDELIEQYLELEKEIVNLTFNKEYAQNADLQLSDVQGHFFNLNEQYGGILTNELNDFIILNTNTINNIKKCKSRYRGKKKAFKVLDTLKTHNVNLKNIELKMGDFQVEFDSILITRKAIFIIEVENSVKDILIDERGDLYRNDKVVNFKFNSIEKMNEKEYMLRNLLHFTSNDELKIEKLVVFTNSAIKVENKFKNLKHCFLFDLSRIIDEYEGEKIYSKKDIFKFSKLIKKMNFSEEYKVNEEIDKYKTSFANILSKIECFGGSEIGQTHIEKIKGYKDRFNTIYDSHKIDEMKTNNKQKENKWIVATILAVLSGVLCYFIEKNN